MAVLVHPDASANSFCTVDEADEIHVTRGYLSEGWAGLTAEKRGGLLISATYTLSTLMVPAGVRESNSLHRLPFPRAGIIDRVTGVEVPSGEIPPDLKRATAILALDMNVNNPFAPSDTAGFSRIRVEGVIDLTTAAQTTPPSIPDEVRRILVPEIAVRIILPGQSNGSVTSERF